MTSEDAILKQWLALKDEAGLSRASAAASRLLVFGLILSAVLVLLIYFRVHSIAVALVSIAIGWSVAERNALRGRVRLWPKLEKYLNWDLIRIDASQ